LANLDPTLFRMNRTFHVSDHPPIDRTQRSNVKRSNV
jgi:hypothetical protein